MIPFHWLDIRRRVNINGGGFDWLPLSEKVHFN
jgi:hypothetical protein